MLAYEVRRGPEFDEGIQLHNALVRVVWGLQLVLRTHDSSKVSMFIIRDVLV